MCRCVWLSVCLIECVLLRAWVSTIRWEWMTQGHLSGQTSYGIIFRVNKGEMKNITPPLCQCLLFHMNTPRPIATWPHCSHESRQGGCSQLQHQIASVEKRGIQHEGNNCWVMWKGGDETVRSAVNEMDMASFVVTWMCMWEEYMLYQHT